MKIFNLILILLVLFLIIPVPAVKAQGNVCAPADPDTGALPPCCERLTSWRDPVKVAHDIERRMMADPSHEYAAIVDCLTAQSSVWVGGPYEVNMQVDVRRTSNELFIHSHGAGTMPSVEDMQNLFVVNPLEYRLIGFDAGTGTWSRCTWRKVNFRDLWPQIDQHEANVLKVQAVELYNRLAGAEYVRWNMAYKVVWQVWSTAHGIPMTCETIN